MPRRRAERTDDVRPDRPRHRATHPLLQRLDDLGQVLAARDDALALIGLGSVGRDLHRLDEHSDMDFFVVVDDGAVQRYLDSIDWLELLHPVAFSFANSPNGRKVLFEDGLFAEYAVFTRAELDASWFPPGRLVWSRPGAPAGLEVSVHPQPRSPYDTVDYHVHEAVTNLFVGLHRDARGERLSAMRFIQSYAVDRVLTVLELSGAGTAPRQDAFAIERGAERRFTPGQLPLASMLPGYEHNREAAAAVLGWLVAHTEVDPVMVAAVRGLLDI